MSDTPIGIDRSTAGYQGDDLEVVKFEDGVIFQFDYVNHNDEPHQYVISAQNIVFGRYDHTGRHPDMPEREDNRAFVLNGYVITRDGDKREDMGTRRRTFMMSTIRNLVRIGTYTGRMSMSV